MRLETDSGDRRIDGLAACRPEQAPGHADLLLVFTKTLHTASALAGVAHLIGANTHVLSLQNGVANAQVAAVQGAAPTQGR